MIPPGFTARAATQDDAAALTTLVNDVNRHFLGDDADAETVDDTLAWWEGLDPGSKRHVVRNGERTVAFAIAEPHGDHVFLDGYVHPDFTRRGLGAALAEMGERAARSHEPPRVRAGILAADDRAQRLFAGRGYEYVRSYYRMSIGLDQAPPPPDWTAGSVPETGVDRELHAVLEEAFADNFGHMARSFEDWQRRVRAEQPDPSLSWIARVDGEPAAAIICAAQRYGVGWVGVLGVRPAWRRRGLARALLLHAFAELYARGERRVGLGVDASNETGATRLYESVGMRVAVRYDTLDRVVGAS